MIENSDFQPLGQMSDTDLSQLQDDAKFNRRKTDTELDCTEQPCRPIYILERRLDRHRAELVSHEAHIASLRKLVTENSVDIKRNTEDTSEILEIVKMAKSFFKVLGWIGDKSIVIAKFLAGVGIIVGGAAALIYYLKYGEPPPK